jgi:hypothetical protein
MGARKPFEDPPFNLGGCFNLTELTLDMERAFLCLVTTTASILAPLDPLQHTRLERIRLTTSCVYQWICKGSRDRLTQAWKNLDAILSKLAEVTIGIRDKKLTLVLGTVCDGMCIPFGKKWLPELLPRFHRSGELRVEYERCLLENCRNGGCFCDHEPACLGEEYDSLSRS